MLGVRGRPSSPRAGGGCVSDGGTEVSVRDPAEIAAAVAVVPSAGGVSDQMGAEGERPSPHCQDKPPASLADRGVCVPASALARKRGG